MKLIGHTPDGNALYEMSVMEERNFILLFTSISGVVFDPASNGYWQSNPNIVDYGDFSEVFGAIRAFSEANFRVNELRQLVNQFEGELFKHEERDMELPY